MVMILRYPHASLSSNGAFEPFESHIYRRVSILRSMETGIILSGRNSGKQLGTCRHRAV